MCRGAEKRRRRALVAADDRRDDPLTVSGHALAAAGLVALALYAVAAICYGLGQLVIATIGPE